MKLISILSAANLILVGFTLYTLNVVKKDVVLLDQFIGKTTTSTPDSNTQALVKNYHSELLISENELRRIVSSELNRQLATLKVSNDTILADEQSHQVEPSTDQNYINVESSIAHYMSVGTISSIELENLEHAIGRLSTKQKQEKFRELARAINSGYLQPTP